MNLHQTVNALEAGFWAVIGCAFLWASLRAREITKRNRCLVAGLAFLAFGVSDAIETQTGAWWRPWWLLLMKAVCVVTLVGLYFDHLRKKTPAPPE